jgi:hypothetical protein
VLDREFEDSRVRMKVIMGKRMLADLSRNAQVDVKNVEQRV